MKSTTALNTSSTALKPRLLGTAEHLFGIEPVPAWLETTAMERHRFTMESLAALDIAPEFVGIRDPLTGIFVAADVEHHLNWALMPDDHDQLQHGSDSLQMPRHIQQVYRKAIEAYNREIFDDIYIAHAWQVDPHHPAATGYIPLHTVPWDAMKSPFMRRLEGFWQHSQGFDQRVGDGAAQIVNQTARTLGRSTVVSTKAAVRLLLGTGAVIAATVAVAIAAAAALAVISAIVMAAVIYGGVLVVGAVFVALFSGVDPRLYGVVRIQDGYGRTYDMLYKLAEWDVR